MCDTDTNSCHSVCFHFGNVCLLLPVVGGWSCVRLKHIQECKSSLEKLLASPPTVKGDSYTTVLFPEALCNSRHFSRKQGTVIGTQEHSSTKPQELSFSFVSWAVALLPAPECVFTAFI